MEPQNFGRYIIIGEIGRGGMATVFHANDPRFEREVAIKVLPHEMLHDPQFRTRFEREAKTIAMLEHPAIVPVYDFGEEDGQPYFVMRYMTGGSLSDRLKNGPVPVPEAARIFEHLAPALDSAHAKGIIHRDLKPGNILFDQYGEPYIADFGIAKLAEAQASMTGSAIIGTPAYMSPEQAQGESIDGRSDVYGMGVILFEMLTGKQPFLGDTPMSVVLKHVTDPVPHILDVRPDLPPAIEAIVEKALAKNRNDRFKTAVEMAEALSRAAHGESQDEGMDPNRTRLAVSKTTVVRRPDSAPATRNAPSEKEPVPGSAAPRKRAGAWIGIGIVVLLLCVSAGVGAYLLRDKILLLVAADPGSTPQVVAGTSNTPGGVRSTETSQPTPAEATPTASLEPTKRQPLGIGGADVIAFLSNNNIWIMKVDGTDLRQLTSDGEPKHNLQWSPDGTNIYYINGKCVMYITLPDGGISNLTCFTAAAYLDAFEISPDGTRVAISVDRILYVVAYAPEEIASARNHNDLEKLSVCLPYSEASANGGAAAKAVRWSRDGNLLAVNINTPQGGVTVDMIRVLDMSKCTSGTPAGVDNFPGARFKMNNYPADPDLPYFSWDGEALFLLNSEFRYQSGYLYVYNLNTKKGGVVDPMGTSCCYSGATFSPDGSYFLFQYQNINISTPTTELYYILYGTEGGAFTPFTLPPEASNPPKYHFEAILRPIP